MNEHCRKSLEASAGMCVARTHYEITVEHVIRQMADEPSSDFGLILGRHGVNVAQEEPDLNHIPRFGVISFQRGNGHERAAVYLASV